MYPLLVFVIQEISDGFYRESTKQCIMYSGFCADLSNCYNVQKNRNIAI